MDHQRRATPTASMVLTRWLMAVWIVLLVLLLAEPGSAQPNDLADNTNNFPIQSFCGGTAPISLSNLIKNRNSTLDELRIKLLSKRAFYARAQALSAGNSVFAVAQCRNYLSTDECAGCFDAAVSKLVNCVEGIGAYVFLDNCFVRYEDFADFYNNPTVSEDGVGTPKSYCGNQSASQPITTFNLEVGRLLSDIRDATPKTSNFYVASTRQITSDNTTMYAFAQCVENTSLTICQTCMNTAYNRLFNCLPSTKGKFFDLGCVARYSDTPFFNENQTTNIINVLKGEVGAQSNMVPIIAGAIGGVVLLFLILVLWILYRLRTKSKKTEEADLKGAINYNYKDLQLATNDFSEENILGKGGYGEVFKAILDDNSIVAVKKLQVQHARVKEEFQNEVMLISNVHHRNLLRLLGWSSDGSDLLLVLEYMPNGSLDQFLWGAKRGTLDWKQRFEIVYGIAKGLTHLHNEFHIKIIHRDIKSSNILLGDDFKPKIADFGLARFQPEDQTHISTKFAGTLGYTAPEYALGGRLSEKVDTYSYGVVILEIVSGRRSTEVKSDSSSPYLLEHAWRLYEEKTHMKFIDETLDLYQYELEHAMKIIEIGLLCTQSPVSIRPTMSEVVLMLQDRELLANRQLTRPTTFANNHDRRITIGSSNSIGAPNIK
ncbi:hypothetical protein OSB04_027660 [Centaurea solstitialis]|uniref:Cysteine-rich receptor-like protein kinase 2 n=1 Tax=Centaurea solstitialis TaxID=347529 RepID=A0AA38SE12_9ASTR|nr:hypothetical protein OSB04_027660 [Centaurea solstitialis]